MLKTEEIWIRLKGAYGDPKTMLDKKLTEVKRIGPLWKLRENNRLIEGLPSITNAMADLMKLSKRHHIEGRLYNGDALDILYGMLGERRVTSWLEKIYDNELKYDDEMDGEALWKKLIKFLEKELKLKQEKLLIKRRLDGSRQAAESGRAEAHWSLEQADNSNDICGWCNSHYEDRRSLLSNGESGGSRRCSFCNEVGHVETNGPRGSSLIQYFACQNFVEMTPAQRYQELRSKELCSANRSRR